MARPRWPARGLRGGTWQVAGDDELTFTLVKYRFAAGVTVGATAKISGKLGNQRLQASLLAP